MTMIDMQRGTKFALAALCAGNLFLAMPAMAQNAAAPASEEVQFSEAERLLWMSDQLKAIKAPTVLSYGFVKDGSYEQGFEDRVTFTISRIKPDGLKAASIEFFTGERNFPVEPADGTDVNPVLKVYFQGDVYEMNRLTDPDGKSRERWRYFQRRIKFALAESAKVEPVKISFDGQEYAAKRISFEPYRNDPKRAEFEQFADKRYSVVVADELPGYVYEIVTEVPGKDGAVPLLRDTLRLQSVAPYQETAARKP